VAFAAAAAAATSYEEDFVLPCVRDLRNVVDMDAIRAAGLKLAVDPLGGSAEPYWEPINAEYRLDIAVVNKTIDTTFFKDPGEHYRELTARFGTPFYTRVDAPATPEQKARLRELPAEAVTASTLAGEPITARLTRAPGDNAPIGGLKVVTANGWFAARPSGTENIYKIYAESFRDDTHLNAILSEAESIVNTALDSGKG